MGKLLSYYREKIEKLDAIAEKARKEYPDAKRVRLLEMVADAGKGKIKADIFEDLGPLVGAAVVKKLGSDFTFEDFLTEADKLLSGDESELYH